MINAIHIPVELCGGPYCGLLGEVQRVGGSPEVFLMEMRGIDAWAYEWADRSTPDGRWVLTALRPVGRRGAPDGKEAADGI